MDIRFLINLLESIIITIVFFAIVAVMNHINSETRTETILKPKHHLNPVLTVPISFWQTFAGMLNYTK